MVKIEFDADPSKFLKNSVSTFKTNRYLQIAAVIVLLLLIGGAVAGVWYWRKRRNDTSEIREEADDALMEKNTEILGPNGE